MPVGCFVLEDLYSLIILCFFNSLVLPGPHHGFIFLRQFPYAAQAGLEPPKHLWDATITGSVILPDGLRILEQKARRGLESCVPGPNID